MGAFFPGIFSTITFLPLLPKMEMDNGIMAKSGRECHDCHDFCSHFGVLRCQSLQR